MNRHHDVKKSDTVEYVENKIKIEEDKNPTGISETLTPSQQMLVDITNTYTLYLHENFTFFTNEMINGM